VNLAGANFKLSAAIRADRTKGFVDAIHANGE
jgi:hypothetical protein